MHTNNQQLKDNSSVVYIYIESSTAIHCGVASNLRDNDKINLPMPVHDFCVVDAASVVGICMHESIDVARTPYRTHQFCPCSPSPPLDSCA
jgi:hypothetical protein